MDKNFVLYVLLTGAGAMVTLVLSWLGVKLHTLIGTKVSNEAAQGILSRFTDFAMTVVGDLNQSVVAQLKASGRWNDAEAAKVKALAMDKLRSFIGPEGIKVALEVLGISNETLMNMLSAFLESQVGEAKLAAKAAA